MIENRNNASFWMIMHTHLGQISAIFSAKLFQGQLVVFLQKGNEYANKQRNSPIQCGFWN